MERFLRTSERRLLLAFFLLFSLSFAPLFATSSGLLAFLLILALFISSCLFRLFVLLLAGHCGENVSLFRNLRVLWVCFVC